MFEGWICCCAVAAAVKAWPCDHHGRNGSMKASQQTAIVILNNNHMHFLHLLHSRCILKNEFKCVCSEYIAPCLCVMAAHFEILCSPFFRLHFGYF